MRPARLAVFAAVAVAVVTAVAWVAGPVDVGDPRLSIEGDFSALDLDEPEEPEEPDCEVNGLGCAEEPGPVSDAVSVGILVFAFVLLAGLVWLAIRAIRKIVRRIRDVSLPVRMDETIDAHIREALRDASEQAAHEVDAVPSGGATNAVVACWVLLEQTAERVGTPRAAAATPTEFTVRLLHEHDADPRAVATLLDLYHEARFGTAPLPDSASGTAAEALRRIADSLSGAVPSAPTEETS